jgi:polyhydroxyalkanoate synthesis repressor PhaR
MDTRKELPPLEIRAYKNRRFYDPVRSGYITYDDIEELIRRGIDFRIIDRETGRERTSEVMLDVLISREQRLPAGKSPCLTEEFLRDLIRMPPASSGNQGPKEFLTHAMHTLLETQRVGKRR